MKQYKLLVMLANWLKKVEAETEANKPIVIPSAAEAAEYAQRQIALREATEQAKEESRLDGLLIECLKEIEKASTSGYTYVRVVKNFGNTKWAKHNEARAYEILQPLVDAGYKVVIDCRQQQWDVIDIYWKGTNRV